MITFVIPAFNEERGIESTITKLREMCRLADFQNPEIIIVNDGSTDRTGQMAEKTGATVVHHLQNMGYGRSLKSGILRASNDTIVITDADGTYPIESIPALVAEYQRGFDMVVGRRQGEHYRESWLKGPLRHVLRFLVEFTAGQRIPDINSGLRVFSRQTVIPYFNQLCNTFSFTTSVTLAYMLTGRYVTYLPIEYRARIGEKKVRLFKDSLRTLQYIVQGALYYNPLKIFLLFSFMTLAFSGVCFLIALTTKIASTFYLSVGGVLVAMLIFSLGLLADQLRQILINLKGESPFESRASAVVPFERPEGARSNASARKVVGMHND